MGTAPAKALSPAEQSNSELRIPPPILSTPTESVDSSSLIESLRERVASKAESVESIFKAVAATAQILTKCDGVALAIRQNGRIVCRARSGEMAPEIGTTINPDSGISGECLRTAAILMCHDTLTDKRVEAEVCRELGIRSIVAVPLRGEIGMSGILEAFSSRAEAFDSDYLNSLRALSQIAEMAYARERGEAWRVVPPTLKAQMRSSQIVVDDVIGPEYDTKTAGRVWIIATVAMALLTFAVAWWSWHHSADDVEPATQSTHSADAVAPTSPAVTAAIPKPTPSLPPRPNADVKPDGVRPRKLLTRTARINPPNNAAETTLRSALPQNASELVSVSESKKGTN